MDQVPAVASGLKHSGVLFEALYVLSKLLRSLLGLQHDLQLLDRIDRERRIIPVKLKRAWRKLGYTKLVQFLGAVLVRRTASASHLSHLLS